MTLPSLELPTSLLSPPICVEAGAEREGLHSAFRRLCEHNQLTVNDVLAGLILPSLGTPSDRLTKMAAPVHLINRGCAVSERFTDRIQALTTMGNLSGLTLRELTELRGVGTLAIAPKRKWCGECFDDDIENEWGPYDRLLWSIDDVQVCPIHKRRLRNKCQTCGAGPFAVLTGRDISGRCPKCRGWLGGGSFSLAQKRDEYSRYLIWIARSFADLLDSPLLPHTDIGPGFRKVIIALSELHFNGVSAQLASAIERNRSVVSTWLAGRASPGWRALCEISFTFQVPLRELLLGQLDAVALSAVGQLPITALERLTNPRKLPEQRNKEEIQLLLAKVERGELPHVLTLATVAERLNINPRDLSRIVPEDASRLSLVLADRRSQIRRRKAISREQALCEEVQAVVNRLLQKGQRTSRRAIDNELASAGLAVRRGEAPFIRELVRRALWNETTNLASGNK